MQKNTQVRILFAILLFMTFAVRPISQFGVVMYYQLNIDSIVEKYCVNKERPMLKCNGKCYLSSQLQLNGKSQETEQNSTARIAESFIPLYFHESSILIENIQFNFDATHFWKLQKFQFLDVSYKIDHPPQHV